MRLIPRRIGVKMAGGAALALGCLAAFGVPAAVAGTNAGTATISPTSGGSQTSWNITLPSGAACSKDTATNAYHVQSYLVPASVNPSTLTFTSSGPTDPTSNSLDYPLYDTTGSPYVNQNTAVGSPALVVGLPNFNYNLFSPSGGPNTLPLPAGTYNVGIACSTNTGAEDVFWSNQVTFTAVSTTVDPNGETWAVAAQSSVPESPLNIALPVSGAAVLLGGASIMVWRRRRSGEAAISE